MDQFTRLVVALAAVERAVLQGQESGAVIPSLARQCSVPPDALAWAWQVTERQAQSRAADALIKARRVTA